MVDKEVPLVEAKKTPQKDIVLDTEGFFVIEVDRTKNKIRVEYYTNVCKENKIVSGSLEKVFLGDKADALCDVIVKHVSTTLRPEHYMYLGREIQRAEYALEKNKEYVQDGC